MNVSRLLVIAVVAVVVVVASVFGGGVARAQAQSAPGHQHEGLYLHVHIGPGFTRMAADDADIKVHGSGGGFGVAIGGSVTPTVVLYGELFDDVAVRPTIEMDGQVDTATGDSSAGVVGAGAGARFYFMPSNFFVSTTVAASRLSVQENNHETGRSDFGFGLSVIAGKEWLVSTHWGLGVGLQGFFGSMKEHGLDYHYITTAGALVFSATYN